MKVLMIADGYLPGFRSGGPVRSLAALVDQLGDEIEFAIVTSAFDLGSEQPYSNVPLDTWTRVDKAEVWYSTNRRLSPLFWRDTVRACRPDVIYINSFFTPRSSAFLSWMKLGIVPRIPVVLAPRGEFASTGLAIKSRKKSLFRSVTGFLRLHEGVVWQASAPAEKQDILSANTNVKHVVVAPNLTLVKATEPRSHIKAVGTARFIWIGRIAMMKNLEGLFQTFCDVTSGNVHLELYGPLEDEDYWLSCLEIAMKLPENVQYEYLGELTPDQISSALQRNDFFISPSRGENFGHTIAEALDQGLPVIISDRTPWRGLSEVGVGWDISLDDHDEWKNTINRCMELNDEEYQVMSEKCRTYVSIWMLEHGGRRANLEMFRLASSLR